MPNNYLYGLTVQGIQSYIFSTNKLNEIVGASELVEMVCTSLFDNFVKEKNIVDTSYLQAAGNIRSVTNKEDAKKILLEFSLLVHKTAPGLPFSQAIVEISNGDIESARQELENKLRAERNRNYNHVALGTMARSKHRRTGDFVLDKVKEQDEDFLDEVTYAKYNNRNGKRLVNKIEDISDNYVFPKEFKDISKGGHHSWLALIHIDGNGMGTKIQNILNDDKLEDKFKELKKFSKAIEKATKTAFNKTIQEVFIKDDKAKKYEIDEEGHMILPFRPLILGGDDVTVIMRADFALKFTQFYLEYFEEETKNDAINLTACGGIAYIKEKFPFHYSANLVEELCKYAKDKSGRRRSCIQLHQATDTIFEDYAELLNRAFGKYFTVGPFYLKKVKNEDKITTIKHILSMADKLNQEDAPKSAYRQWINTKFNHPVMAETLLNRIKNKSNASKFEVFHSDNELKNAIVYQTLLDVQCYEN